VERTAKEASDFYVRKISLIKEKISKLQEIIGEKRESLRGIEIRIYSLIQQQQQTQAQKN
jgi:prefoldin subunit 5